MAKQFRQRNRSSGATWFIIKVGLLCCVLWLINAVICQFLVFFFQQLAQTTFNDRRVVQAIMFFGPVLMIALEFWIYDRQVDRRLRKRQKEDSEDVIKQEPDPREFPFGDG